MRVSRRGVLRGAAALSTLAVPGLAAGPVAHASGFARLDAALDGIVDVRRDSPGKAPSALALVTAGHRTWWGAAGFADWDAAEPVRDHPDRQFRVGSVTKMFTATIVLQLVDEGRVGLDDPIGRHLPGLVPGEDRILVRHLLGMCSGLVDYLFLLYPGDVMGRHAEWSRIGARPIAPRDLVEKAAEGGLKFDPGRHFDYCTTNYLLLGLLVEKIAGRPYRDELHRRLIGPLGLARTDLPTGPELHRLHLKGYGRFLDRSEQWVDITRTHEHGWAGGALVSTRRDLARFASALLGGELLAGATLELMKTPIPGEARPGLPPNEHYGLGLQRFTFGPGRPVLWGHTGVTHGYRTAVMSTGAGHFVTCQSAFPTPPVDLRPEMDELLDAVFEVLGA